MHRSRRARVSPFSKLPNWKPVSVNEAVAPGARSPVAPKPSPLGRAWVTAFALSFALALP